MSLFIKMLNLISRRSKTYSSIQMYKTIFGDLSPLQVLLKNIYNFALKRKKNNPALREMLN